MKKHYHAIMLVFASENHGLYKFMKRAWLTYHDSHPDIKVFFVYGAGSGLGSDPWDLCYEDLPETHEGGVRKVLRAMKHIYENYTCDFFIRTNLSTFWHFDTLIERLKLLPRTGCLSATKSNLPKINGGYFVVGFDMIFNYDTLEKFVEKKEEIDKLAEHPFSLSCAEDRMLSVYLTDIFKLPIIPSSKWAAYFEGADGCVDEKTGKLKVDRVQEIIDDAKRNNKDHFRIKTHPHYYRNTLHHRVGIDDEILRILCRTYYGKEIPYKVMSFVKEKRKIFTNSRDRLSDESAAQIDKMKQHL